ncbi:MAG: hypothetical protein Q8N05_15375 [Bacteroidota bacterium]|nr:hypothetical protein [Bacteroidota bacterium]
MMNITRDNYEPFFLDFLEGNLAEDQIDQFLDFLKQNPDLKEELHQFENLNLPEEQIVFSEKMKLYKNAAEENTVLENTVIALLEGDLEDEERKSFETYLSSHPELQKEYNLFSKTRLVPDAGIMFPDKKKLYRKSGNVLVLNWVTRAAAVLVLIWGINTLIQDGALPALKRTTQEIAVLNPTAKLPVEKTEIPIQNLEAEIPGNHNQAKKSGIMKQLIGQQQILVRSAEKASSVSSTIERDYTELAEFKLIVAKLETGSVENHLAFSYSEKVSRVSDSEDVMTLDEFLAIRAKKVGNEGILSAQRIARMGLDLVSEISGKRIGYGEKNGKITSLEFESKLLAFTIPLEKNK